MKLRDIKPGDLCRAYDLNRKEVWYLIMGFRGCELLSNSTIPRKVEVCDLVGYCLNDKQITAITFGFLDSDLSQFSGMTFFRNGEQIYSCELEEDMLDF